MHRIWIYAIVVLGAIVASACSDDVTEAHDEIADTHDDPPSDAIEIIEVNDSTSNKSSSSIYRTTKANLYFSNKVEIKSSSSEPSSSSEEAESSSSSKPAPKSSSSSAKSSSSAAQSSSSNAESSSSSAPKSSAALRFFDCEEHDCVSVEYLNPDVSYGEFLDKRDDQVYRTIVISNHVWTAQNMNYKIETEEDSEETNWCYGNDPERCQELGRLYTWEAAQKVCPEGWHLPTADEWAELLKDHSCNVEVYQDTILIFNCSGGELKSSEIWGKTYTNSYGFSVVPAGIRYTDGTTSYGFYSYKKFAEFWSATEFEEPSAYAIVFNDSSDDASLWPHNKNEYGFSVRCVKGKAE